MRSSRPALIKLFIAIIIIPIGLLTKLYSGVGKEFVTDHLGGVFYVIFFIVLASLFFPKTRPIKISLIVFFITCLLEFSQLIHIPALELSRENFIFRALFGSTFNPYDFIWYFVGALLGLYSIFFVGKIFEKS